MFGSMFTGIPCRLESLSYPYAVPVKTSGCENCFALQLGAGSGKGQNPARVNMTIAQTVDESEANLQSKAPGVTGEWC